MSTVTPNLGLTLPTPNVDTGWGSTLNTDFTTIDSLFATDGSGTAVGINIGASNTLLVGGTMILGRGDGSGTVTAPTIRGAARTGTNAAGSNLTFDAANGTGTGGSGSFIFRTAPAGASGTVADTMRTAMTIDSSGNITANVGSFLNSAGVPVGATLNGVNSQTGTTYTLVLTDNGKLVEMSNSSSNTVTVPPNSSVAFPVGAIINIISTGTGQTTIAQGSGVTIWSYGSKLKLTGRYSQCALIKRSTDIWALAGDLQT